MPGVKVYGVPVPQGSMRCLGRGGRATAHQLVPSNDKKLGPWRTAIANAGRALIDGREPFTGPVAVSCTFTLDRPATVPLLKRLWPFTRSGGDLDKLARSVLDGLTTGGVWADDAQVVMLTAAKTYPDTPGVPDRLDRPGAFIRIEGL